MGDHVTVWADEMRLKQVLRNLIANALHYSPQRTPICIVAAMEQDNRMVRISVIDRGQGIPPDKQQVIFDKFVRLERDMQSIMRGSGLGLYISRQLVEAMQGAITVTSSGVNGQGSSFSFTLPTSDEAKTVTSSPRGEDSGAFTNSLDRAGTVEAGSLPSLCWGFLHCTSTQRRETTERRVAAKTSRR